MFEGVMIGDMVHVKKEFWKIGAYHYPGVDETMKQYHDMPLEVVGITKRYLELITPDDVDYYYPIEWVEIDDENHKFRQLLLKN